MQIEHMKVTVMLDIAVPFVVKCNNTLHNSNLISKINYTNIAVKHMLSINE